MNLRTAAQMMRAETLAEGQIFDKELTGFSIDSRTVASGELFFALSPEDCKRHFFTAQSFDDAHRFIPQALEAGAAAVVARRERVKSDEGLQAFSERLLLVEDVINALQSLAHEVVETWGRPVIGITGSAGKTTAKDLTAQVLAATGRRVLKTQKNFNNELGVPLSVLQMESAGHRSSDYDVAVLEMGMSMFGEIKRLTDIAPPDVGLVLLVAPVHLEFFGTIEKIAEGKAHLVEGIKPGGTAILNADDPLVAAMRAKHDGPVLTFGIASQADVAASDIVSERFGVTRFHLRTPLGESAVELPLPGRHNLMNALAASAVATYFGIAPGEIAGALCACTPSEKRGEILRFAAGFTVVDDSYNSNPRSLLSMAQAVMEGGADSAKRRIVVAGEMLELGPEGGRMHRVAGRELAEMKIDLLWGVRGLAGELLSGAREVGMSEESLRFFETAEEAADALSEEVRAGDLILVKGSRGVQTDKVVKTLRERYETKG